MEVITIIDNPGVPEEYNIIAIPTLVKPYPLPEKTVIDDPDDDGK
ncbi:MAG: circadian clock KaiB family protein [Candidatus Anammoxibacter sp.]